MVNIYDEYYNSIIEIKYTNDKDFDFLMENGIFKIDKHDGEIYLNNETPMFIIFKVDNVFKHNFINSKYKFGRIKGVLVYDISDIWGSDDDDYIKINKKMPDVCDVVLYPMNDNTNFNTLEIKNYKYFICTFSEFTSKLRLYNHYHHKLITDGRDGLIKFTSDYLEQFFKIKGLTNIISYTGNKIERLGDVNISFIYNYIYSLCNLIFDTSYINHINKYSFENYEKYGVGFQENLLIYNTYDIKSIKKILTIG